MRSVVTSDVLSDIVVSPSPSSDGNSLSISIFGTDGNPAGYDSDGSNLSYPSEMNDLGNGSYSFQGSFPIGVYFGRVTVDGVELGVVVIRSVPESYGRYVGRVGEQLALVAVGTGQPSAYLYDPEGLSTGSDSSGESIQWPQAMEQVPGSVDCWHLDDVIPDDSGKNTIRLIGDASDSSRVLEIASRQGDLDGKFDGWEPAETLPESAWVGISFMRRMTGWSSGSVDNRTIKDLRRFAIDSFSERTNRWMPRWTGTWHGLKGQGSRLYLPVPLVLPTHGGSSPVIEYVDPGTQTVVSTVNDDWVSWRVSGAHESQPFVELVRGSWDENYDVRITGTFGSPSVSNTAQLCLVGLARWHSLSFGVGPDDARDQATLNRITSEGTRDRRVSYSDKSVSSGLTGDPVVDRALARFTINRSPTVMRSS